MAQLVDPPARVPATLQAVACRVNQFRVTGNVGAVFSQRGDSGSLVTTGAGEHLVGMLFTSDAAGSIAHPIEGVLRDLAAKIPQMDPLQFVYV